MVIADRLRVLREEKQLSQGDIEKRTGLLRCYISRVENGHTVPAIETLEKMARARWKFPCTSFSTTARSRPNCRISRSGSRLMTCLGAVRERMHVFLTSSAAC